MRLGILADTHDEVARTKLAVQILRDTGAEALIHSGDLASPPIVEAISVLPSWFVFGNHDADMVSWLQRAAKEFGPTCLGWGGVIELGGRRIGVAHGNITTDIRHVLADGPEILLTGHAHYPTDQMIGSVRRINPGALHRADDFTVALLELSTCDVQTLRVAG
jgi:putative phosphoesterase